MLPHGGALGKKAMLCHARARCMDGPATHRAERGSNTSECDDVIKRATCQQRGKRAAGYCIARSLLGCYGGTKQSGSVLEQILCWKGFPDFQTSHAPPPCSAACPNHPTHHRRISGRQPLLRPGVLSGSASQQSRAMPQPRARERTSC